MITPPDPTPAIPEELDLLPLFGVVIYPLTVVPLAVGQPASVRLLDTPDGGARLVALVTLRAEAHRPEPLLSDDCYVIGTAALVHRLLRLPDGTLRVAIQGLERIEVLSFILDQPVLRARVRLLPAPPTPRDERTTDLMQALVDQTRQLVQLVPNFSEELLEQIRTEADPQRLAYLVATATLVRRSVAERQQILELPDTLTRLEQLSAMLAVDLQMLRSGQRPHAIPSAPAARAPAPLTRLLPAPPANEAPATITPDDVNRPGRILHLCWMPTGGACVPIEAVQMPGHRGFLLTGERDPAIQDSAQIALSWIRSEAGKLGLPPDFYEQIDLHIHIPTGIAPDDTNAAGMAIATTLVSLLTGRPARAGVALAGAVTLHGHIRPVGHVREKLLAAYQAGIPACILSVENANEIYTLPEDIRTALTFIFVQHMNEVLAATLQPNP